MATGTSYGTNFSVADNPTPATVLEASKWNGKIRCQEDKVTLAAQRDVGSYLYVGKVPKGAIPLFSIINYSTGSATATLKIGSLTDDDLFGTFTDIDATNVQVQPAHVDGDNTPLTVDTNILVLTGAANMLTNDVLSVKLFYAVE